MAETAESAGWRQTFAGVALGVSIFSALWFAIAALGSKFGLWSWQFGLVTMTFGLGMWVIGTAAVLAVAAVVVSLIRAPRTRPFILAAAALLVAVMAGGRFLGTAAAGLALPPIHDVQTDWSNPIAFTPELMAIREADGALNPVEDAPRIAEGAEGRWPGMGGRLVSEVQEAAEQDPAKRGADDEDKPYRPIEPLVFDARPGEIFDAALALVEDKGWAIVTQDRAGGVIEATATTGWFGFKDDVAIHISDRDGQTRVDMRSVSRVGLSDLGANAKRVSNYLFELSASAS